MCSHNASQVLLDSVSSIKVHERFPVSCWNDNRLPKQLCVTSLTTAARGAKRLISSQDAYVELAATFRDSSLFQSAGIGRV